MENKRKLRKYDPSYFGFGITNIDDCPQYIICADVFANRGRGSDKT